MITIQRFLRFLAISPGILATIVPCVAADQNDIETFVHGGLPFIAPRVAPSTIRELKGLVREEKSTSPNPYEPTQNDTSYTFMFRGLEVRLLCPPNEKTECLLAYVKLSQLGQKVKFGLDIGTTTARLIEVLGEPQVREKGKWIYRGESSGVAFRIENNRISEIEWLMYTG